MRDAPTTLMLRTTVVRGRNLAAKDKSGTSDPYLVVTLGDAKQSTSPISKTLNPEWNTTFDLPIAGPQSLLLEAVCWDKDRFGKDYMGTLEVIVEELFVSETTSPPAHWYPLESRKPGKKSNGGLVSGEIQMKFELIDTANATATPTEILHKFMAVTSDSSTSSEEIYLEDDRLMPSQSHASLDDDEDGETEVPTSDEADAAAPPEVVEKRRRKRKLRLLRRKNKSLASYEFGASDCVGIVYLEIGKVTDLPPERNVTRTSFDMDPFVVASLGRKTYRTRIINHDLNPVFNEKMVFQVMKHEQSYSMQFSVVDRDKLSGNDFVGTCTLPLPTIIDAAPQADPTTGLYAVQESPEAPVLTPTTSKSKFRLPLSRSSSSQSLKQGQPVPAKSNGRQPVASSPAINLNPPADTSARSTAISAAANDSSVMAPLAVNTGNNGSASNPISKEVGEASPSAEDADFKPYTVSLELKNKDKWSQKHNSQLHVRAKYLPYSALIQQFWRAMLKSYDADESGSISKVELTTMLDTLGSTLKDTTIDAFFRKFPNADGSIPEELPIDSLIICLEDELKRHGRRSSGMGAKVSRLLNRSNTDDSFDGSDPHHPVGPDATAQPANQDPSTTAVPEIKTDFMGEAGESADLLPNEDLVDEGGEEHVIEIRECPICHQPRLNKRSDSDIIAHIATCASQDWRQVNNIVMAGFVTASQAQRKWYSKVINKVSYGGYKLGANSANILVQDRLTGQINEERMSVYVRLGIRLLYKGLQTRDMEKKRIRKLLKSLSVKQGKKYDDPASAREIEGFINFHKLNMSEVLRPNSEFKNFNEFFYRELKPDARPCSAPNNPKIIVSPADCRSVVFNKIDDATNIWIKGRQFSVKRLLGEAYPGDVSRYNGGALGIFRLAPQDYHRFHIPVDGIMDEPKLIAGEYYTVNPMAIRSALDVYGENVRVIVPIDSVAHKRVTVVCVGAMMVGSTVITRKKGDNVKRAEELGYFKFGGSTLIVLFEPGVMQFDQDLTDNSSGALETLVSASVQAVRLLLTYDRSVSACRLVIRRTPSSIHQT